MFLKIIINERTPFLLDFNTLCNKLKTLQLHILKYFPISHHIVSQIVKNEPQNNKMKTLKTQSTIDIFCIKTIVLNFLLYFLITNNIIARNEL